MIPATSSRSRASSIGSSLQRSTSTRDGSSRWAAGSWAKIAEAFPEAFVLDVTATPERLEGRGLAMRSTRWWSGPGVADLVDLGFLARQTTYAGQPPDLFRCLDRQW